ncbi:hypothetical protein C8R46DRAFT_1025882 [Mycena filopes]|nr:hypothetical protein C8R46DRAFT_1025882 [Mycena filopes]
MKTSGVCFAWVEVGTWGDWVTNAATVWDPTMEISASRQVSSLMHVEWKSSGFEGELRLISGGEMRAIVDVERIQNNSIKVQEGNIYQCKEGRDENQDKPFWEEEEDLEKLCWPKASDQFMNLLQASTVSHFGLLKCCSTPTGTIPVASIVEPRLSLFAPIQDRVLNSDNTSSAEVRVFSLTRFTHCTPCLSTYLSAVRVNTASQLLCMFNRRSKSANCEMAQSVLCICLQWRLMNRFPMPPQEERQLEAFDHVQNAIVQNIIFCALAVVLAEVPNPFSPCPCTQCSIGLVRWAPIILFVVSYKIMPFCKTTDTLLKNIALYHAHHKPPYRSGYVQGVLFGTGLDKATIVSVPFKPGQTGTAVDVKDYMAIQTSHFPASIPVYWCQGRAVDLTDGLGNKTQIHLKVWYFHQQGAADLHPHNELLEALFPDSPPWRGNILIIPCDNQFKVFRDFIDNKSEWIACELCSGKIRPSWADTTTDLAHSSHVVVLITGLPITNHGFFNMVPTYSMGFTSVFFPNLESPNVRNRNAKI